MKFNTIGIVYFTFLFKFILLEENLSVNRIIEDNGISLLSDFNYDEFIEKNKISLIFFYFSPCPLCNQILPELIKTSELLNDLDNPVKIGSLNCTENSQIKRRLNVDGLSLRFIMNGSPMNYTGGRTSEEIISWVKKIVGPNIGNLQTANEIEELKKYVTGLVAFFGDDENLLRIFKLVSKNHPQLVFVKCSSIECLDYYNVNNGNVIIFKKYDEGRNDFRINNYNDEELNQFIEEFSKPSVMNFDFRTANYIFENNNPGLFLYVSNKNSDYEKYYQILTNIAPSIKGKLQPVITDITDDAQIKLSDLIGVKKIELPVIMIHDTRENLKSFKMNKDTEINTQNILNFIEDWENDKLIRYIKSQKIPEIQNDPAFVLVGSTLENFVNDKNKDVLVLFYAPWCKHSKELMPIYEEVAKKMKIYSDNLLIAKFDAYHNEPSIINLKYYPTVAFWKANNKIDYLEFKSQRTEENLINFLKINSSFNIYDQQIKDNGDSKDL